jgi:hypothetical protein
MLPRAIAVRLVLAAAVVVLHVPAQAQSDESRLPVSLERIRRALEAPPPVLQPPPPPSPTEPPMFRTEVRQPISMTRPVEDEPWDPTMGLPSAGQLVVGGIGKLATAVGNYKRGRAKKRARKEVDEALAAFCATHECPAPAAAQ